MTQPALELNLLGGFELRVLEGEPIALPTRKCQAVIVLLAMRPDESLLRERLCELLWPGADDARARHSLRQTLVYLRKALPPSSQSVLQCEPRTLALDSSRLQVDVARMERGVALGTRESLLEAARLYRGDLLAGISLAEPPFEQWLSHQRERLRALMVSGFLQLIELHLQADEIPEAIDACLRLLQIEPLHEQAHRRLIRLHLSQGRRAAALAAYHNLTQTLRSELGSQPEPQTRALYAELGETTASPLLPEPALERSPGPAVGRSSELQVLGAALERAWASGSELHLLVGEAGVGKTHVAERLAEHALRLDARVLRGRCYESEQVLPLSLWSNLFSSAWLRENASVLRDLRALPPELRTELAVLLPEFDASRPEGLQRDALRMFKSVLRTLRVLIDSAPLLLILEDLHWADEMSLRLLCYLARDQRRGPGCFVLGCMREEELAPSSFVHTAVSELERDRLVRRLCIAPLSRAESFELAQREAELVQLGQLDESGLEQLWTLSEGNPLVIVESARSLAQAAPQDGQRSARMAVEMASGMQLPERVRALIRNRVLRVSSAARELLAFAAVAGRELRLDVLLAAGLGSQPPTAALHELLECQLMRANDDRIYFTHDRIRETLYSELVPARRRMLHAAVAAALEHSHADHLEPVLGHIGYHHSNAGNAEQAVHFLLRFSELAWRGHGGGEALAALERAALDNARLPEPLRGRLAIEIVNRQAFCLASLGRFADLIARLDAQRARLAALGDSELAGQFHFWWGFACTLLAQRRDGEQHACAALEHAQRAGDARTAGYAHTLLAYLCAVNGRCAEGLRHGQIATAGLAGTKRDPDALTLAWLTVGLNHLWSGDWPEAYAAAKRAQELAIASESQRGRAFAGTSLGYAYGYTQHWPEAMEATRRGLEDSTEPFTLAHALWISGFVEAGGGEPEKAIRELALVIEQLEAHGMRAQSGHARIAQAAALVRAGEALRALQILVTALEISRSLDDMPGLGACLRVRGQAELAERDWSSAEASLEEAMQVFRACGARIEIANTWTVRAQLARATGDRTGARAALEEARRLYLECGAERAAAQLQVRSDAAHDNALTTNG